MFTTKGYAAHSAHEPLRPFSFNRREPTPNTAAIELHGWFRPELRETCVTVFIGQPTQVNFIVVAQEIRPLRELWPPEIGEFGAIFDFGDGVNEDEHIGALLDGHCFAAVVTAQRMGIGPEIVRRVGEGPVTAGGVAEDRHD